MPTSSISVRAPAGYAPVQAIAFGTRDGPAVAVDTANPLPIAARLTAAAATPLAGTASASATVGPFAPDLGRAIWLTLTGTWTGTCQLLRSTDGGATLVPLTVAGQAWASFTANCCEAVGEESVAGAAYYLQIALTSGGVSYRVAQ
jgi:hypothetical protein